MVVVIVILLLKIFSIFSFFQFRWFTNHHMCRWVEVKEEEESMKVEVKEEEETMKVEVIIIIDLGQSLLMR